MSDADDIDEIRQQKRQELIEQATGTPTPDATEDESTDDSAQSAAPDEPIHVESPAHLDELAGQYRVVLADFYADWCGPCQMLEPIVQAIARDTDAAVAKVDIDQHQGLAQQMGVRGVPTLFLYVDGEPAERLVGMQDEGTLRNLVGQHL